MYLVYYNLINPAQYNFSVNKYYNAKTSVPTEPDFIKFVFCYLEGLKNNIDIDNTNQIANYFENYNHTVIIYYTTEDQTITGFIDPANIITNYEQHLKCLNPEFF